MKFLAWITGLFAPAEPLVRRPGLKPGEMVTLSWRTWPLDVYVDLPRAIVDDACMWWNVTAGKKLFNFPVTAINDIERSMGDEKLRPYLRGIVLVRGGGVDPGHGDTDLRFDKRTGEIINAIVTLPYEGPQPVGVARHELGHALGLDHGPSDTLMQSRLSVFGETPPLAWHQLAAVKRMG